MQKFLCFLFGLFALATPQTVSAYNSFHPEKDALVYGDKFWAEVVFKGANTGVTQFRVIYEAPANMVFAQLIDTNNLQKYHSSYADSRCLTESTYNTIIVQKPAGYADLITLIQDAHIPDLQNQKIGGLWTDYWYLRFNLPWPLSDKWVVQKVKVDESHADKNEYRVEYKMEHGNLKILKGWWEVVEVPGRPGWTEFRGETESDPGIPMPNFLARSTFKSSLRKEFETNTALFQKRLATQK